MKLLIPFLSILFLFGCDASKKITETIPEVTIEEQDLDTLVITAPKEIPEMMAEDYELDVYNPSYTLKNDLIHTRLDLSFDWGKQAVIGKANLTFSPVFYPVNSLVLDAQNFDIHTIQLVGKNTPLEYDYKDKVLTIQLDRTYKSDEQYEILIDYTAHPSKGESGGSAAITSDQGLFFINHDGSDPDKPMQIWTQGETEYNSRWFPTTDKPIERSTQEMYLTVADRYTTLSNGSLVSSTDNGNGTRTDYWKMDLPHAPYLFMLAVGEFAVVKDTWKGIPVEYYVEPEYEKDARAIFAHTPEMLQFFSDLLGVDYPWSKYSQIVVRDYVSGAMENTTGVIFGEFVQKTTKELIDNNNDRIVAHELFHHWFGDLVTCESWANLTLNEGFANYSEYLWAEHKYGIDDADQLLRGDQEGYFQSAGYSGIHPLIHFAHDDKEDMFDAHSYNKGGAVLHMLRKYLGDGAFFAGLRKYLKDNEYTAVESHELRMAFEDVAGEDLNWFFNQWYFSAGHPILDINYAYDAAKKEVQVTIEQQQDVADNPPIFVLPMGIDIYLGKRAPIHHEVKMTKRKQTFSFKASEKPMLVNVDTDKSLLAIKTDNKIEAEWVFQYFNGQNYLDRWEAMEGLKSSNGPAAKKVFKAALSDKFWGLRRKAIGSIQNGDDLENLKSIARLAEKDPRSEVRAEALGFIGEYGNESHGDMLKRVIKNDPTYRGMSAALSALAAFDAPAAMSIAKGMENEKNPAIIKTLATVFGKVPDAGNLAYFEKNIGNVDGYASFSFFEAYLATLKVTKEQSQLSNSLEFLTTQGKDNSSGWKRYGATKTLYDWSNHYSAIGESTAAGQIKEIVDNIIAEEKDSQLKSIYARF